MDEKSIASVLSLKTILQLFFLWLHYVRYSCVENCYPRFVPFDCCRWLSSCLQSLIMSLLPFPPPYPHPTNFLTGLSCKHGVYRWYKHRGFSKFVFRNKNEWDIFNSRGPMMQIILKLLSCSPEFHIKMGILKLIVIVKFLSMLAHFWIFLPVMGHLFFHVSPHNHLCSCLWQYVWHINVRF